MIRTRALALLLTTCGALTACVSDQHRAPETPADATPVKIIPAASGSFVDTDGNRYRDSSTVVVYVLADSTRYALPMKARGEFNIRLESGGGDAIAEWTFDKAQTAAAVRSMPPGPGFVFDLDLRQSPRAKNTDRIDRGEASMVVTFTPEGGQALYARTSAPILIGPIARPK